MSDELVTIASFDNTVQANLARNELSAAGIRATLVDEHTVGMNWMLSNAIGGVKLVVKQEDYADAARLLADPSSQQKLDDEGQAFVGDEEGWGGEPAEDVAEPEVPEPKGGLTLREQEAERALRAAVIGVLLPPLQLYATWLLFKVWLAQDRLLPSYRRQAWKALAIAAPFLLLWLLMIKVFLMSGEYKTQLEHFWSFLLPE